MSLQLMMNTHSKQDDVGLILSPTLRKGMPVKKEKLFKGHSIHTLKPLMKCALHTSGIALEDLILCVVHTFAAISVAQSAALEHFKLLLLLFSP